MTTMEGRVSEGAKWMDRHVPGWLGRIDLERLRLESCTRCVLGQACGNYSNVVDLEVRNGDIVAVMRHHHWARAHGFTLTMGHDFKGASMASEFARLRDLWVTEILSRRFAEQQHEPAPVETPVSVEG